MKRTILIILVVVPFLGWSQLNQVDANGQRQGVWKKEQPNGRLLYEGNFKNDKPVGEWKRYHEGGQVKAVINYRENSDSAFAQLFDIYGIKIAEGIYINEKREGNWIIFSENRKIAEENYRNGLKNGISRKYYDTGELLEETDWKDGKQEGNYRVFFKSGKPYLQCKMSNNQRNGLSISYFENGMAELEAFYTNNLRNKTWKFYDESGKLLYELNYEAGKILNPEVQDSIENLRMQQFEKQKGNLLDPEKYMLDPSEYMEKMGVYR